MCRGNATIGRILKLTLVKKLAAKFHSVLKSRFRPRPLEVKWNFSRVGGSPIQ